MEAPTECAHRDKGVCTFCAEPIFGKKVWKAQYHAPRFKVMDGWQFDLLHQFARVAGMGAAETLLEV